MKHLIALVLLGTLALIWMSVEIRRDIDTVLYRAVSQKVKELDMTVYETTFTCEGSEDQHTVRTTCMENEDPGACAQRHRDDVAALKKTMCGS